MGRREKSSPVVSLFFGESDFYSYLCSVGLGKAISPTHKNANCTAL